MIAYTDNPPAFVVPVSSAAWPCAAVDPEPWTIKLVAEDVDDGEDKDTEGFVPVGVGLSLLEPSIELAGVAGLLVGDHTSDEDVHVDEDDKLDSAGVTDELCVSAAAAKWLLTCVPVVVVDGGDGLGLWVDAI